MQMIAMCAASSAAVLLLGGCRSYCQVHGGELQHEEVRTAYGLYRWPPDYFETASREFPHVGESYGGCMVPSGPPEKVRVQFCSECRAARKAYFDHWDALTNEDRERAQQEYAAKRWPMKRTGESSR